MEKENKNESKKGKERKVKRNRKKEIEKGE